MTIPTGSHARLVAAHLAWISDQRNSPAEFISDAAFDSMPAAELAELQTQILEQYLAALPTEETS